MTPCRRCAVSLALVWAAAVLGGVHAGFSALWALGGTWLLATVGQWAVDLSARAPLLSGIALGLVAVVKALAAAVPVAVAYGRVPWRRFWRAVSWSGAALLVVYGGVNTVVAQAVLTGLVRPEGGYDAAAMRGHAWLWDPLFLAWGAALLGSLWLSRQRRPGAHDPVPG